MVFGHVLTLPCNANLPQSLRDPQRTFRLEAIEVIPGLFESLKRFDKG